MWLLQCSGWSTAAGRGARDTLRAPARPAPPTPPNPHHPNPCSTHTTTAEQSTSGSVILEASLRGRHLRGAPRQLPDGYSGAVVTPSASGAGEAEWCSTATFSALTYWNHDGNPAASDWQARSLDWLALADKVRLAAGLKGLPKGRGCLRLLRFEEHVCRDRTQAHPPCPDVPSNQNTPCCAQVHAPVTLQAVEEELAAQEGGEIAK
jgi:hypothetical protein